MDLLICNHMLEIFFVAKKQVICIGGTFESQLVPYILHIFPTLAVREIEDQHHSLTGLEIRGNNGSKLLLPGCIPNAELDLSLM